MSWLFSRALVEDCSQAICLGGVQSVQSNITDTPQAFLFSDRTTESSPHSRFGMTFVPLMRSRGEALLTSFLAGFPVKPIPQRLRAGTLRTISGRKCDGSWQMQLPGTFLQRTLLAKPLTPRATTWKRWVTKPAPLPLERQTWALTIFGSGLGYLHTPTCAANYSAASMQKHSCARAFVIVFGKPNPTNHEWLMGWPSGWSDTAPLAMDRFQSWLSQQPSFSQRAIKEAA